MLRKRIWFCYVLLSFFSTFHFEALSKHSITPDVSDEEYDHAYGKIFMDAYRKWAEIEVNRKTLPAIPARTDVKLPNNFPNQFSKGFHRIWVVSNDFDLVKNYVMTLEKMIYLELKKDSLAINANLLRNISYRIEVYKKVREATQKVLKEYENEYLGYHSILGFIDRHSNEPLSEIITLGKLVNDFKFVKSGIGIPGIIKNYHGVLSHRLQQFIVNIDFRNHRSCYDEGKSPLDYYRSTSNSQFLNQLQWDKGTRNELDPYGDLKQDILWKMIFDDAISESVIYPQNLSKLVEHTSPLLALANSYCQEMGPWFHGRVKIHDYPFRFEKSPTKLQPDEFKDGELKKICNDIDSALMN